MTSQTKLIIIELNKAPVLEGAWTVGEVTAAAEFLARWIAAQQVTTAKREKATDATVD